MSLVVSFYAILPALLCNTQLHARIISCVTDIVKLWQSPRLSNYSTFSVVPTLTAVKAIIASHS